MQLEYKITFETGTENVKANRNANNYIMQLLKTALVNSVFVGEVERLTNFKTQSPHSLETYHEIEQEIRQ